MQIKLWFMFELVSNLFLALYQSFEFTNVVFSGKN